MTAANTDTVGPNTAAVRVTGRSARGPRRGPLGPSCSNSLLIQKGLLAIHINSFYNFLNLHNCYARIKPGINVLINSMSYQTLLIQGYKKFQLFPRMQATLPHALRCSIKKRVLKKNKLK